MEIQSQLPTKNSKQPLSKNIKCQCKNKILQKEILIEFIFAITETSILYVKIYYALKANRVINPKVKNHATICQV